ncbi:MAG: WD40 repeat domain-containing serine/threonine-protein kinase [Planctomycetota bacterium]
MANPPRGVPVARAKEIFAAAIELPAAERPNYINQACADDAELRSRVEALVRAFAVADGHAFLSGPSTVEATEHSPTPLPPLVAPPAEAPGTMVGPYRLERLLGEGGFGRVYLARQEEPVARTVAVKILKPGMDSRPVIARFEAERQAVALMEHPGIARILDAGTTAMGRPFFVMEYVAGQPVTGFCDQRGLELRDRLELFERLCLAVHHAHQKGVIHRDLKPTNILVTEHDEVPLPKVIDFGIAKAVARPLTDRTLETEMRQLLGTPLYMSPEQARVGHVDVDTRSDIYSLGIILYQLLTGSTPFWRSMGGEDVVEIQRIIREDTPQRPSLRVSTGEHDPEEIAYARRTEPKALSRALRGDLDWIVLKALEKDANRRYESAAAFARDVRRHLDHEPVLARRPGTAYSAWKFVQRHQVAATAAVAIGTAMVIGFVLAMLGLQQASEQRDLARAELRDRYVVQARASRAGNRPGRRSRALEALRLAAEIRRSNELRNEVIACLTLTDVEVEQTLPITHTAISFGSRRHERVAVVEDGRLRVVDAASSTEVVQLPGETSALKLATFDPSGRYLAAYGEDLILNLWDLDSATAILTLAAERFLWSGVTFDRGASPSRWIALTESDATVRVYRLPDGALLGQHSVPERGLALASSPDGTTLAIATSESQDPADILLWRWQDDGPVRHLATTAGIYALDWSADGRTLAAAGTDTNVYLWSTDDGEPQGVLRGHQSAVVHVCFDPTGALLASYGWDDTVQLWNMATGEPHIGPLRGQRLLGFSSQLLTTRRDTISTWRIQRATELRRARASPNFGAPARVAVSADAAWLATSSLNGLRLWDASTLEPIAAVSPAATRGAHFGVGGQQLLGVSEDALLAWPLSIDRDGAPVLGPGRRLAAGNAIRSSAVRADGRTIVVLDNDGARVLDATDGRELHHVPFYRGMATIPSLSPDGRWLFTGTWKGEPAAVWNLQSGTAVSRHPGQHVEGRFSPDGRWLCVSDGAENRVFEVGTWQLRWQTIRDNADDLAGAISFTADGSLLALGHSRYVTHLVEPGSGRVLAALENPDGVATSHFALDGQGDTLALVTPARDLMAWDLRAIRQRLDELQLNWREDESH